MKRWAFALVAVGILALAGASVAWLAFGKTAEPQAAKPARGGRAPLVEVKETRVGDITRTLELTGEVVATDSVVIAATKEGPIAYCPWREGDEVRAGEKLVEIDREAHRAEVQAARAALAVAEARLADLKAGTRPEKIDGAVANVNMRRATLEEARKSYERQMQLIERDFTSVQDLDQAREKMKVAEAQLAVADQNLRMLKAGPTATEIAIQEASVQEASARLALAAANLAECVIAAPHDGRITRVHVRPGDLAVPRSPLVEMYAPASLAVRFSLPEVHAAAVRPGLRLEATLDALPGRTFTAEVTRVYPELDPNLRTRTVEAKLGQSAELMPHQFARLTLQLSTAEAVVILPADAVLETPQGTRIVFVIEDGKAKRRTVELGIEGGQGIQAIRGVSAGERVVVKGNEELRHGAAVRVAGEGPGPQGQGGAAGRTPADRKPGGAEDDR